MSQKWTGERLETNIFNETAIEHLHRYAMAMELVKNKTVLDIACGEGYGANLLASSAVHVIAIDIDKTTIQKAADKYKKPNLIFKNGSITQIPLTDESIDVVVCFETLEHLSDHDQLLQEIKRVLKPQGICLISTPDKKNYSEETGYVNPHHVKELHEAGFKALMQKNFKKIKFFQQSFVYASLLTENNTAESFKIYSGDYSTTTSIAPSPMYWVVIASDVDVPSLPSSIYYSASIFNNRLSQEILAIKKTFTYRLGHFFLSPFKWLRKL